MASRIWRNRGIFTHIPPNINFYTWRNRGIFTHIPPNIILSMNPDFIGRTKETALLQEAMSSSSSEMIAVIGRRRVGKTHLVRQVFGSLFDFEMTGMQHTPLELQLTNFVNKLAD